jgi:hypothetical protein
MHLFRMYWMRTLKKPGAIFLWLLLPFVFMTIYQLTFGGDNEFSVGLAIVDHDSTFVSRFVGGAFDQGPLEDLIDVQRVENLEQVHKLFGRGNASAALVIPDGFSDHLLRSEPVTLTLYKNPRHFFAPQIAEGVVDGLATMGNGVVGLFHEPLARIQSFVDSDREPTADDVAGMARTIYSLAEETPSLEAMSSVEVNLVEEEQKEPWEFNMGAMFFPGLVAFALMSLSLALEYRFLFDRKKKINHRIVTTPMRPVNILLQQRLYSVAFLYVMAVGTAVLGGLIFRIPPIGIVNVNIATVALILFITGINGIIFGMSNSLKAVSAMSSVVMMVLMVMGGGFFPIEFYPGWAQSVAEHVPTGIVNIALTRSLTGRDPGISYPVLYAYCGAFFALSVVAGRKRII